MISIIIPSYNRATLIKETLQSVVAQTSPDWECIVVDDGSTDDTVNVVSAFAKADSRIHLFQREQAYASGGNGARQMGLEKATSDWVMFLDSDDLLHDFCITSRYSCALKYPEYKMLLFLTATFKDKKGDSDILWNIPHDNEDIETYVLRFLDQDMPWHTSGVLWKKEFLLHIGGWNQSLKAWQDWELHVRALCSLPKVKYMITDADTLYRLDVKDSIASSKKTDVYSTHIFKAIQSVENQLFLNFRMRLLKQKYRYLVYRTLIAHSLKTNKITSAFQLAKKASTLRYVNVCGVIIVFCFELLNRVTRVKRFFKHKLKLSYYDKMRPNSTFLKKRL